LRHAFHLVDASPWPLLASLAAWTTTLGGVAYMQYYSFGLTFLLLGIFSILLIMFFWFRDIIREGTFLGYHTQIVQSMLRFGVILFIVSEVMFFFSFFWAFFAASISGVDALGNQWPPAGMMPLNPFLIPLSNTLLLLLSGVTVTWAHHAVLEGNRKDVIEGLGYTIILGILFTLCQAYEYINATFQINDGIFGTTFYVTTGFHGMHVLIGTIFLAVMFYRQCKYHFTQSHHVGLEGAIWYWHFVDVVWLFLFVFMYLWTWSLV
jgi:heme/copper-type cytochrome/quinol oxidase subunit 3